MDAGTDAQAGFQTEVYLAFQIIPRVRQGNNFEVVDKAIAVVEASGVTYQVSAMETTMRGPLDVLLDIVRQAQDAVADAGAVELITNIKIHQRRADCDDPFCTYDRGVTKNNAMFVARET